MRIALAGVLLLAAAAHAARMCTPLPNVNIFMHYNGTVSNCEPGRNCAAKEPIAFSVGTFGYNLACFPHTFSWNFGDGGTSTSINPTHAYANPGIYTVKLTMTDPLAGNVVMTAQVIVAAPVPATSATTLALLALALAAIAVVRVVRPT